MASFTFPSKKYSIEIDNRFIEDGFIVYSLQYKKYFWSVRKEIDAYYSFLRNDQIQEETRAYEQLLESAWQNEEA